MAKRVLIVGGAANPKLYRPFDHWRQLLGSVPSDIVDLVSGESAPALDGYTHLIVTGTEASIVDDQPWYAAEESVIRQANARGLAILGSCFGHQMLVRALSGPEYVGHGAAPEIGWHPIETLIGDPILDGLPNPWYAFHLHYDEVISPPEPWRVLARSEVCSVQATRYGDRPVWGLQSHPEVEPDEARTLLQEMTPQDPAGIQAVGEALKQAPRDDGLAQQIVDRFLECGRGTAEGED